MFTENLRIFLIFPYKFHGQWTMDNGYKFEKFILFRSVRGFKKNHHF